MIINQRGKRKNLIVFEDMIADVKDNKKLQAIIEEMFIRCRKLNISLAFITQPYCCKRRWIKFKSLFDYEKKQQN